MNRATISIRTVIQCSILSLALCLVFGCSRSDRPSSNQSKDTYKLFIPNIHTIWPEGTSPSHTYQILYGGEREKEYTEYASQRKENGSIRFYVRVVEYPPETLATIPITKIFAGRIAAIIEEEQNVCKKRMEYGVDKYEAIDLIVTHQKSIDHIILLHDELRIYELSVSCDEAAHLQLPETTKFLNSLTISK